MFTTKYRPFLYWRMERDTEKEEAEDANKRLETRSLITLRS